MNLNYEILGDWFGLEIFLVEETGEKFLVALDEEDLKESIRRYLYDALSELPEGDYLELGRLGGDGFSVLYDEDDIRNFVENENKLYQYVVPSGGAVPNQGYSDNFSREAFQIVWDYYDSLSDYDVAYNIQIFPVVD